MKWTMLFACALGVCAQKIPNAGAKLPDTPGRATLERVCSGCHDLENVVRARMTQERWEAVVDEMVTRGATASDAEIRQIVAYLTTNFGKPKREAPKL